MKRRCWEWERKQRVRTPSLRPLSSFPILFLIATGLAFSVYTETKNIASTFGGVPILSMLFSQMIVLNVCEISWWWGLFFFQSSCTKQLPLPWGQLVGWPGMDVEVSTSRYGLCRQTFNGGVRSGEELIVNPSQGNPRLWEYFEEGGLGILGNKWLSSSGSQGRDLVLQPHSQDLLQHFIQTSKTPSTGGLPAVSDEAGKCSLPPSTPPAKKPQA